MRRARMVIGIVLGLAATTAAVAPQPVRGRPAVVRPPGVRVTAITETALTIGWRTAVASEGIVSYSLDQRTWRTVRDPCPAIHHEVRLTGLRPSTRVYFRLSPPPGASRTGEVTGTYRTATLPRRGTTHYLRLPWLVIVHTPIHYRDAAEQPERLAAAPKELTSDDRRRLEADLAMVRAFYWRNSRCRLDIRWRVHYTDAPFIDSGPGRQASFEAALAALREPPEAYAGVLFLYGWDEYLDPERARTLYRGQAFGGLTYGVNGGWDYKDHPHSWIRFHHRADTTWVITHEFHHALDSLFEASGYPEYAFNHPDPSQPIGFFGEHWDANAFILRMWRPQDWFALARGDLVVAPDRVGDGMPDDGDLPITRRSFYGRGRRSGWTDLRMMLASIGVLTGISNDPIHMTRWAGRDRLPDGRDPYPLYGDAARRRRARPTLDGRLDRDEWQPLHAFEDPDLRAETFCQWDEDGLYLAARCSRPAEIRLQLDATANGWFAGSDNYWLNLFPDGDRARVEVSLFDWERFGQRDEMGRMQYAYRNREKVRPEQIRVATGTEGGRWVIEIRVPRNERTGLLPAPGAVIGLSWGFAHSREPRTLLSLFEPCTFFPITCADGAVTP